MNIQLPVVIWTVICFIILMLVLRFLLFKPVLELLDKRKERFLKAEEKKAQEKSLLEEHEKRLALMEEDRRIQQENLIKSELEIIRIKNKQEIEEAKTERLARVEEYRLTTEKEKTEIKNHFINSSEEIAKIFADRIISQ